MLIQAPANANGFNITVTTTATGLFDLINTAQSTSGAYASYDSSANGMNITVEGDDIRMGDGADPTALLGKPMYKGTTHYLIGRTLKNLRFISTTGNTSKVSIEIGESDEGESSSSSDSGVSDNTDVISTAGTYASLTLTNADTEYEYTLTGGAKAYEMIADDCNTFKYRIGGAADSTSTDYNLVKDGSPHWRQEMELVTGTVLRFRSDTAAQVIRISLYN